MSLHDGSRNQWRNFLGQRINHCFCFAFVRYATYDMFAVHDMVDRHGNRSTRYVFQFFKPTFPHLLLSARFVEFDDDKWFCCFKVSWWIIESQVSIFSDPRSEEHTSELQSRDHIVCRLLLEKDNVEI